MVLRGTLLPLILGGIVRYVAWRHPSPATPTAAAVLGIPLTIGGITIAAIRRR
ncbi:hypothetical protein [Streptomyces sp. NPDC053427]|uniref:hypothetical protein n=1 Tax=Streptomyces sp. NPDC053427 TaxID=3365701 RepID=UPI0037CF9920